MMASLPANLADEPMVQRTHIAFGNELDRADAVALAIREGLMPATATDTYNGLSMLEAQLNLPVAPVGLTEDQRRALVLAWISARRGGTGLAWVALMSLAFGGNPWTYFEGPNDFQVTIQIPLASGSLTAATALSLARAITPAHIDIIPTYGSGFLIGISQIGVEPL